MKEPNAMSFHVKYKPEDFMPANEEEKQSQVIMRESVGFWQDGFRRLRKNKVAMVSLFVIIVVMIFSFIVPAFYPYDYKTQIKGSENLHPMQYSEKEIERMDAGEKVFPHVLGTDKMGRDYAIRVMMGSRISLLVGLIATAIIFVIGSLIGSISAFFGGWVDLIIMRIVDIIYTIPDFLLIVLLSFALKDPLAKLAQLPGFQLDRAAADGALRMAVGEDGHFCARTARRGAGRGENAAQHDALALRERLQHGCEKRFHTRSSILIVRMPSRLICGR